MNPTITNNCTTFAEDVITQDPQAEKPWILIHTPVNTVEEMMSVKWYLNMRMWTLILILFTLSHVAHAELSIVHYERAYELIYRDLHKENVKFKDIVFAIENAYLGDEADYNTYCKEINRMASALREQAKQYAAYEPTEEMALLRAISSCYIEPNEANRGKPFSYDMLPTLQRNYPHYGLVTKLLETGYGTCRSLPFLFKILADELGVNAYITLAPQHYFISHKDAHGRWWHFETTIGRYLTSAAITELTEMHPTGIRTGLYMRPLREEDLMMICLNDLMEAYFLRTGRYTDPFTRRCYTLGLLFYPNSMLLTHLYNDKRTILCERAQRAGIKDSTDLIHHPDFQKEYQYVESIRERIKSIGYQEWTDTYLKRYMQRMRNYVNQHPNEFK